MVKGRPILWPRAAWSERSARDLSRIAKVFLWLAACLADSAPASAQVSCFAQVTLDRHTVYVQQPFRITITVLTATWYTAPLDFETIQIPNAFILPFSRTTPGMFPVHGKSYAGLQFYFIVFPYNPGTFVVPSLDITAETPPEGSSKSQKVHLQTQEQEFTVKPFPSNFKDGQWLVAKDVHIAQTWNKALKDLKVGDVINRSVTIDAAGTLPQFIPQLPKQTLDFAGTYLQDATMKDERNDYDANGRLTQSIVYLLEKEGDYEIPPLKVTWWDPNSSKLYSRTAASEKIHVGANPNLGMLNTIRDSLQSRQAAAPPVPQKQIIQLFGLAWYWAVAIMVACALLLFYLIRTLVNLWRYWRRQHLLYLASEAWAFRHFMRSSLTLPELIRKMYAWWDRWSLPGKSSSISYEMRQHSQGELRSEWKGYTREMYQVGNLEGRASAGFKKDVRKFRKMRQRGQ